METAQKDTLVGRIQRFFADNPNELLTTEDALVKFDCSRASLTTALKTLRDRGQLDTGYFIFSREGPGKWV